MALRFIRTNDDPVLRKTSREVTDFNERLHILVSDMWDTMYDADGVGLAAVQVGVLKRIIVVDTGEEGEAYALVNPVIVQADGEEVIGTEGCLSVPGRAGLVPRPEHVVVKAQTEAGEPIEVDAHGLLARVFCHEIDHLDGTLYIDKMTEELYKE